MLSGDDEAKLTFLAVRRWFGWSAGRLLALDIGGGSFEVAAGEGEDPDVAASLPLGASRLTRDWLHNDPPKRSEMAALRKYAKAQLAPLVKDLYELGDPTRVVATSKSFRSLARIAGAAPYSKGQYVRRSLSASDLEAVTARLAKMPSAERALLPGVSPSRAQQLLAAALVAPEAMDLLGVTEVEICPWALTRRADPAQVGSPSRRIGCRCERRRLDRPGALGEGGAVHRVDLSRVDGQRVRNRRAAGL